MAIRTVQVAASVGQSSGRNPFPSASTLATIRWVRATRRPSRNWRRRLRPPATRMNSAVATRLARTATRRSFPLRLSRISASACARFFEAASVAVSSVSPPAASTSPGASPNTIREPTKKSLPIGSVRTWTSPQLPSRTSSSRPRVASLARKAGGFPKTSTRSVATTRVPTVTSAGSGGGGAAGSPAARATGAWNERRSARTAVARGSPHRGHLLLRGRLRCGNARVAVLEDRADRPGEPLLEDLVVGVIRVLLDPHPHVRLLAERPEVPERTSPPFSQLLVATRGWSAPRPPFVMICRNQYPW